MRTQCLHGTWATSPSDTIKALTPKRGIRSKSRANVTEVVGNYFSTKNSDGSYEADFPNGGTVYFIGNVVEQGVIQATPQSSRMGKRARPIPIRRYMWSTTRLTTPERWSVHFQSAGLRLLSVKNNIFAGGGTIGATLDTSNKVLTAKYIYTNAAGSDYHLAPGSAAIDAGVNPGSVGSYNLTPTVGIR